MLTGYPVQYIWVLALFIALGVLSFFSLLFIPAFYGRYTKSGVGPTISNRLGWIIMEGPAAIVFPMIYLRNVTGGFHVVPVVFICIWLMHYLYRAFIYPFQIPNPEKPMPALIVFMAILFNYMNGWLMGNWLAMHAQTIILEWLYDIRFIIGALLFFVGLGINRRSDSILLNLRKPGEYGYKIPHGGLYQWVSCPNFLGEIIQWLGWGVLTWSIPGMAFAFWTFANLFPRALSHHKWYRQTFPEYPKARKAVIPFVI